MISYNFVTQWKKKYMLLFFIYYLFFLIRIQCNVEYIKIKDPISQSTSY